MTNESESLRQDILSNSEAVFASQPHISMSLPQTSMPRTGKPLGTNWTRRAALDPPN